MERTVTTQQCVELVTNQAAAQLRFSKAATTVKVAQIMHAARPVHDAYNAEREKLLREFATIGDAGDVSFATPEKRKTFEAKHAELLKAQTTLSVPRLAAGDLDADNATPVGIFPLLAFVDNDVD